MIREVVEKERDQFNKLATHPMQTWEWGEFRKSERVDISRIGEYKADKLVASYQISWHKAPGFTFVFGYCPKSKIPSVEALRFVKTKAIEKGAIMVKWEPNVLVDNGRSRIENLKKDFKLVEGKPLFTKNTFWLDLTKNESELLAQMKPKTRYNVRLAEKKGVEIIEDSTENGFEEYWELTEETSARQVFYAHDRKYHLKMWQALKKAGIAYLFKAVYKKKTLTTWIVFVLNGILYYPYGASSSKHRELMASNLMMWKVILFGKKLKLKRFDMWGSLGKIADKKHAWYGFHKFKEGYGGELVEMTGSWDLVINPVLYWIYRGVELVRWPLLRALKKIKG